MRRTMMNNKIILLDPNTKEMLELQINKKDDDGKDYEHIQKLILEKAKAIYLKETYIDTSLNEQFDDNVLEKYKHDIQKKFCIFIKKYIDEPVNVKVVLNAPSNTEDKKMNLQIFSFNHKHNVLNEKQHYLSDDSNYFASYADEYFFFRLATNNIKKLLIQQDVLPYDYGQHHIDHFYDNIIVEHVYSDNLKIMKWCNDEVTLDLTI